MANDGESIIGPESSKLPVTDVHVKSMNLFQQLTNTFGVLSSYRIQDQPHQQSDSHFLSTSNSRTNSDNNNSVAVQTKETESDVETAEREIMYTAEYIAVDLIWNIDSPVPKNPPNKICKTMRRVAKDMLKKHEFVFKGMVKKLNLNGENLFQTFVIVSEELFADGEINWGRIVAVYAFAAKLAMYIKDNFMDTHETKAAFQRKLSMFLGKYVASKLKHWIIGQGGWNDFVESFPDKSEFEEKLWRGLVLTTIGFVALGTMVASR